MRKCKDCGVKARLERPVKYHGTTHFPRCAECHRKYNKQRAFKLRHAAKLRELKQNPELERTGWKRCSGCFKKKVLSEFSTRYGKHGGRLHKLCDTCLSSGLLNNRKDMNTFTPKFWRRRAYSCNTTFRNRLKRLKGRRVTLAEMDAIKPQDLIGIHLKQHGQCYYCGVTLTTTTMACDHAHPISRNGKHTPANIKLTCVDCNNLKHTKTEQEFDTFLIQYAEHIIEKNTRAGDKELQVKHE